MTYDDDARAVEILNNHLDGRALRPPRAHNRRAVTASISHTAHNGLREIAQELGYVYNGTGNVSLLLEAIGTRTVKVTPIPLLPRSLGLQP